MKKRILSLALAFTFAGGITGGFSSAKASDIVGTQEQNIDEYDSTEQIKMSESSSMSHNEIMDWFKNNPSKNTFSINEYELLNSINASYKESFNNYKIDIFDNMDDKTLSVIINYKEEYIKKVYALQLFTDEQLGNFGYDNIQIDAIRTFDASEEKLSRAATRVSVDAGFRNKQYTSAGGTTVDLIVAFNSKGIQSNWFDDLFCVVWSAPLTVVSSRGYVEYRDGTYGGNSETITHTPRPSGMYSREIQFAKNMSSSQKAKYVFSGSMIINLKSNTKVYDFSAYCAYGYSGINVSGISVSYPGGLSISFGKGMETAGYAYASL